MEARASARTGRALVVLAARDAEASVRRALTDEADPDGVPAPTTRDALAWSLGAAERALGSVARSVRRFRRARGQGRDASVDRGEEEEPRFHSLAVDRVAEDLSVDPARG